MAKARWAAVRSLATAVRLAVRPGGPSMGERLTSVPRLVRATFSGEYRGTTRRRLLLVAGAVLYVVSPVDFVPEALFSVFGLVDDAFVLSWIAAALVTETESFLAWERSAPEASAGASGAWRGPQHTPQDTPGYTSEGAPGGTPQDAPRGGASRGSHTDPRRDTVQGHVIR